MEGKKTKIVIGVVALALVLLAVFLVLKLTTKEAGGQLTTQTKTSAGATGKQNNALPVETVERSNNNETPTAMPELAPADAYLSVQVGQVVYDPIPLTEDNELTITQAEDKTNVIGVTPSSIWMKSSTCDNQNCVEQGVVTLDNMTERLLQNMIICLPNELVMRLLTPDEAQREMEALYGAFLTD